MPEENENVEPQIAPEAEQAASWSPPSREEFEQVVQAFWQAQARNEAMASYINAMGEQQGQQPQAQPSQPDEDDDLEDIFDPDKMRQLIAAEAQKVVAETLNQHPMVKQAAEQRGAQIAQGVFNEIEQKIGKFDRSLAYHVAQSYAYANPNAEPVQALYAGAQQARVYAEQERQAAIEEYKSQLANLATPQPDATNSGAPAAQPMKPVSRDYEEVAANYFARKAPQMSPN